MSEELMVRQCAPTLAGIKTGSLFPCPCTSREELLCQVRSLNRRLSPKGLCLLPLRFTPGSVLLYLYRPATLRRDLSDGLARDILAQAGYEGDSCGRCVATLIRRLRQGSDFPHEIGLFLSYPPEDVRGFVETAIKAAGTRVWSGVTGLTVGESGVSFVSEAGFAIDVACDAVVDASDCLPNTALTDGLEGVTVIPVGDCKAPYNIAAAISDGNLAARSI